MVNLIHPSTKKNLKTPKSFLQLIKQNREEIKFRWIEKLATIPGAHYEKLSPCEISQWTSQGLDSILTALETGSYRKLDKYLSKISFARLKAGFPISEIIEGLLFLNEIILELLNSKGNLSKDDLFLSLEQLDQCLREIVSQFGQTYACALQRQHNLEVEKNLAESESLRKITSALLHKLTTNEVLKIVCTEAQRLTGATGSSISLLDEDGNLQVTFSIGQPSPSITTISGKDSVAGIAMDLGKPIMQNETTNLLHVYHENQDLESLLVIPLRVNETSIGILDIVNKSGGFSKNDIRIMGLFADQSAIAIENARLQQQAEQLAVIEERQRLARELHDSVTQALYSVTLYTDATRLALDANKIDVAKENLDELRNMAREAILDMRLLVFELHPPILEQKGLVNALRARLEAVEVRSGVIADILVENEKRLPQDIERELYKIAQEAITNTVKHAKAKKIRLKIIYAVDQFYMEIWDNGVGFSATDSDTKGGFGLRSITERVNQLNGNIAIKSKLGKGTTIKIEIPA